MTSGQNPPPEDPFGGGTRFAFNMHTDLDVQPSPAGGLILTGRDHTGAPTAVHLEPDPATALAHGAGTQRIEVSRPRVSVGAAPQVTLLGVDTVESTEHRLTLTGTGRDAGGQPVTVALTIDGPALQALRISGQPGF